MENQLQKDLLQKVEGLNEDQLHTLYKIISERLKLLHRRQDLRYLKKFEIFDPVSFVHSEKIYKGIITRLNQRSATVRVENGYFWKVSPSLLTKIGSKNIFKELIKSKA